MIVEINDDNFLEYVSNGLKIVEVFAPWCGYCTRQRVELEKMDNVNIGALNSENTPISMKMLNVTVFPTLVVFKNGKELNRFLGLKTKYEIMDIISRYIK